MSPLFDRSIPLVARIVGAFMAVAIVAAILWVMVLLAVRTGHPWRVLAIGSMILFFRLTADAAWKWWSLRRHGRLQS